MRRKLVAGNWKMNGTLKANEELVAGLSAELPAGSNVDVAVFPPAIYLSQVIHALSDSHINVGAQNVCEQAGSGAFTGEVSAEMLADIGCRLVIVGHSERRAAYGDTNALVAEKVGAVLDAGLVPVLCVGETDAEREAGQAFAVIAEQLMPVLKSLSVENLRQLIIAYEPVWAIGTGKTASPAQAQEVHGFIRATVAKADEQAAQEMRLLYGGSVKAANAAELFAQPDIDGGLIGGASLDAQEFSAICRAAE
ncbi:triose-phosphate isomerase [Spongiibacter sp. KMU-158]|uniref:Triosephosphate isomerase n=1 Tax=Spongiibacter pelagi TaxID=2760804 RepID=A0A927GWC7_9GAMM|nr:triose-phosphate isomerase [Spongiibacter pelagi]MBD2859310.1 triose-phosphate isomerase [Spongiibacter pelagi]